MFTLHLNVTQMLDDSVNSNMNTESDISNLSIFAIPNYMWKSDCQMFSDVTSPLGSNLCDMSI